MFGLFGGGNKLDFGKILGATGGALKDLDGSFGRNNLSSFQAKLEQEKKLAQQKQLLAQATQGLTPQQAALAQLNPQAFSNRQINNQFQDPLAVQAQKRADQLAQNTIGNTQFNQNRLTQNDANAQSQQALDNQFRTDQAAQRQGNFETQQAFNQQGFDANQQQRGIANQQAAARLAQSGNRAGEFGLTPVFGRDADGNRILIQTNKAGGVRAAGLPEGVTLEDDRFKSAERAQGKVRGETAANLPAVLNNAGRTLDTVDQLLNHKGLESGTGFSSIFPAIPGTDRKAFDVANKQLGGQVFLQGFEALKGGGVITEVEGLKAEQALARADQAQSQEDYVAALNDYRTIVAGGIVAAHQKAGLEVPKRYTDILKDAGKPIPQNNATSQQGSGGNEDFSKMSLEDLQKIAGGN